MMKDPALVLLAPVLKQLYLVSSTYSSPALTKSCPLTAIDVLRFWHVCSKSVAVLSSVLFPHSRKTSFAKVTREVLLRQKHPSRVSESGEVHPIKGRNRLMQS